MLALATTAVLAAFSPQLPLQLDRRALLTGAATSAALLAPLPAFARSKEKAAEKALQKATAGEARQAMKEYKFAPRPELEGNAKDGYAFKAGTVGEGSQGELASYFKDKGAGIQAKYAADQARSTGMSSKDAAKMAEELETKARNERKAAYQAKKARLSEDEKIIKDFCNTPAGKTAVDNVGRKMCP